MAEEEDPELTLSYGHTKTTTYVTTTSGNKLNAGKNRPSTTGYRAKVTSERVRGAGMWSGTKPLA